MRPGTHPAYGLSRTVIVHNDSTSSPVALAAGILFGGALLAAVTYTVPGRPGRIVVSTAMLEALDEPGRRALLAHERAHVRGRHYIFAAAARLAAAANPLVRPLAGAVEYAVERWADEHAADELGDRRQVATAIATAAIATKRTGPHRGPAPSWGRA